MRGARVGFCADTSWTDRAVRRIFQDGRWGVAKQYRRAPDAAVVIDLKGYERGHWSRLSAVDQRRARLGISVPSTRAIEACMDVADSMLNDVLRLRNGSQ